MKVETEIKLRVRGGFTKIRHLLRKLGFRITKHRAFESNILFDNTKRTLRKHGKLIRVRRVACAHDCGLVVNPDALRMQIEGSILQTLSRTLHEEVAFDRSRVTSVDWASYPILRFPEVPAIAIDLVVRPQEPPLGAGEAAATPVPAALANAVFDACGARLRTVPFTRERVLAAIS